MRGDNIMEKKYNRMQSGQGRQTNNFTDRDMLQDMLITEKYLTELLNHAVLEASSDQARQLFKSLQDNAHGHAQSVFDVMSELGWYSAQNTQRPGRYRTGGQNYIGQGNVNQMPGVVRGQTEYPHASGRSTGRRFSGAADNPRPIQPGNEPLYVPVREDMKYGWKSF
jgi:hypothetical protein